MVVVQANRIVGSTTAMPLITLLNDKNGKDEDQLTVNDSTPIESLGSETIDLLNQRVSALKFRMKDSAESDPGDPRDIWMSKSGLLLQVSSGNMVITRLSSYQGPQL